MKAKKLILSLLICVCMCSLLAISTFAATSHFTVYGIRTDCFTAPTSNFSISSGQSVTISWTSGKNEIIYLKNNTTGNSTAMKSSTSSVTYTNMRAGSFTLWVEDGSVYNNYNQKFTVTTR